MSVMSNVEARFCRSTPWRIFARRVVLPWAASAAIAGEVLEIGGGSGAMAVELLRRRPDIDLTVADLDPTMVAAAELRLAPFGDRVRAVMGDATALGFPDDSFDTVCSWLMLHHTIQWRQVLAETARVIRPTGRLVGYDLADTKLARVVHQVDGSEHQLIQPDLLDRELGHLGFTNVEVETALGGLVMRFSGQLPGE